MIIPASKMPELLKLEETFRSNSDKTVVVSTEVEWLPISTAKLGQKMQLHTIYGTAVYGELTAKNIEGYNAWAPAPKRPQWLLDLMNP